VRRGVSERLFQYVCAALDRKDRATFGLMAAIALFMEGIEEEKRMEKQEVPDVLCMYACVYVCA
jgi:hypothetical protein